MSAVDRSPGLTWDGLELPTTPPEGDPNWFILVRDIVGWWNGAPVKSQPIDHWSGDGQVETDEAFGPRTVEIVGSVVAKSGYLIAAQDAIRARKRGTLVVDERDLGVAKQADAVRAEPVRFTHLSENLATFSLFLRIVDPLRYGTSTLSLSNGSNAIPNDGDVDASPLLTLTAPQGALTITHPGGVYTFPALASGTRVLDFRNGDVWNGQTRVFPAETGPKPVVRDGGSSWTVSGLTTGPGAGTATLSRFEAWS